MLETLYTGLTLRVFHWRPSRTTGAIVFEGQAIPEVYNCSDLLDRHLPTKLQNRAEKPLCYIISSYYL